MMTFDPRPAGARTPAGELQLVVGDGFDRLTRADAQRAIMLALAGIRDLAEKWRIEVPEAALEMAR